MQERTPPHPPIHTRSLQPQDWPQWGLLYQQYAHFYEVPMTATIAEKTWAWLMNPQHPVEGIVALSETQQLMGLAHFRACPDPLIASDVGFLDDLYVLPERRGAGIGRALIQAVAAVARERHWPVVRWVTAKNNAQARRLYDQIAEETQWVTYDLEVTR
ncbi:GNAT family N-acetyltransferase [Lampropedia puyangensis]|uniref:GNAT family N-acetyltransferase n=1 Tax=Lampropedia puyangensis TaxID=1330072 RepID=A0A4S8FC03_9BURK|nr:GNAT family N-acetyltransferase [Lampropedia puyangensis]THU05100.1 GNAT family N-acetyltransferase [Lampropedia puyangensis]